MRSTASLLLALCIGLLGFGLQGSPSAAEDRDLIERIPPIECPGTDCPIKIDPIIPPPDIPPPNPGPLPLPIRCSVILCPQGTTCTEKDGFPRCVPFPVRETCETRTRPCGPGSVCVDTKLGPICRVIKPIPPPPCACLPIYPPITIQEENAPLSLPPEGESSQIYPYPICKLPCPIRTVVP